MANRLRKLVLKEISFVDRGANPGARVVIAKREEMPTEPQGVLMKIRELLGMSPIGKAEQAKEEPMPIPSLESVLSKLTDEEKQAVMMAIEAAAKPAEAPHVEVEAMDKPEDKPVTKREDLPEDVRKALDERDELAKKVSALEAEKLDAEFAKRAKALDVIPGGKTEDRARILKHASIALGSAYAEVEALFNAAAETITKAAKLAEVGSSADESDPMEQLNVIAKRLQEKDATLTEAKAFDLACTKNPEIYKRARAGV